MRRFDERFNMLPMRFLIIFFSLIFLSGCVRTGKLNSGVQLPRRLNECSGITSLDGRTLWVIEDGGNADNLYALDTLGNLIKFFEVSNAKNTDWEALTSDQEGSVYIGDFGNNRSKRKDLVIHKLPNPMKEKGNKIPAKKIRFTYPDQKEFPPPFARRRFDAEAFFHFEGRLYIINKNQSDPFDGTAAIYSVPDQPGEYVATKETVINTCEERSSCRITDAALSPSRDRLVLLSYGKLWVFENFKTKKFSKGPTRIIDLQANTQLEAICFIKENLLYIADERKFRSGGNLYAFPLPQKSNPRP